MIRFIVIVLCLGNFLNAQEPVGGPVTDVLVDRRIDAILDRMDERQSKSFESVLNRPDGPLAELRAEIKQAAATMLQDRQAIAEMKRESDRLFPKLNEFVETSRAFVENSKEFIVEWKPIRNGIDAINELIWKLFIMGLLILVAIGILKYLAVKILGLILPKWLMPIAIAAVFPSVSFGQIHCEHMQGPNPVYRIYRPQYSVGYDSCGHAARPPSVYQSRPVIAPVRTIAAPIVQPVYQVIAPVVNTVKSVTGCENGQCGRAKSYTPALSR